MDQRHVILDQIVKRLVPAFHPRRIYLFGSQARGDAGPDSDFDVLLVLDEIKGQRWRVSQEAYLALRDVRAAVDVVVWPTAEFDQRVAAPASLPATVVREGRLLYAA